MKRDRVPLAQQPQIQGQRWEVEQVIGSASLFETEWQ